jgi:hypothetical protein
MTTFSYLAQSGVVRVKLPRLMKKLQSGEKTFRKGALAGGRVAKEMKDKGWDLSKTFNEELLLRLNRKTRKKTPSNPIR